MSPYSYVMVLISLALAPNLALSAWFAPRLESINNCILEKTLSVSLLKEQSLTSELYLTRIRSDQESETARLLEERGLAGMVFDRPIYPADTAMKDSQSVRLTGVVYRREPSSLERFFAGSQQQFFYEIRLEKEIFLLHLGSLSSRPLELCEDASGQM